MASFVFNKIAVSLIKQLLITFPLLIFSYRGSNNPTDDRTLKNVYKDAFLVGTAVTPAITSGRDKETQDIVIRQFNSITVENVMKAAFINPEPGIYNFAPADEYVDFGERNKMFIVGHTLVWHNQCPAWFFINAAGKPNSKEEQIERLRSHIEAVAGRYAGRVHAWDVVNEVIDNDGSYRPTTWVNAFGNGDTLVKYAFKFAAATSLELLYPPIGGKTTSLLSSLQPVAANKIRAAIAQTLFVTFFILFSFY